MDSTDTTAADPWRTITEQRAAVAAGYGDVLARSLDTLNRALEREQATGASSLPVAVWFAQNMRDQGEQMRRRLVELGAIAPERQDEE
ncbi:hypothetical protein [Glycomyces sp. MUSA5-2]|uniref:hypothetical protein n=1 Tax=Glycomyces sp. MUSA5-2 TaxID=2053002 RepID=UPI00300B493A